MTLLKRGWESYWLAFAENILPQEVILRPRLEIEKLVKDIYYFEKEKDSIRYTEVESATTYSNSSGNFDVTFYPYFFGATPTKPVKIGDMFFTPCLMYANNTLEKLKGVLPDLRNFEKETIRKGTQHTLTPNYQIRFLEEELNEILEKARTEVLLA